MNGSLRSLFTLHIWKGRKAKEVTRLSLIKLGVVKWYNENGENNYATERQFSIDRKTYLYYTYQSQQKGFTVALACHGNRGKLQKADDDVKVMRG